jgi:hypothetical protein
MIVTRPASAKLRVASRTGPRLTLSSAASAFSFSRSPALRTPLRIMCSILSRTIAVSGRPEVFASSISVLPSPFCSGEMVVVRADSVNVAAPIFAGFVGKISSIGKG